MSKDQKDILMSLLAIAALFLAGKMQERNQQSAKNSYHDHQLGGYQQ